jgi:hypothetical protein
MPLEPNYFLMLGGLLMILLRLVNDAVSTAHYVAVNEMEDVNE